MISKFRRLCLKLVISFVQCYDSRKETYLPLLQSRLKSRRQALLVYKDQSNKSGWILSNKKIVVQLEMHRLCDRWESSHNTATNKDPSVPKVFFSLALKITNWGDEKRSLVNLFIVVDDQIQYLEFQQRLFLAFVDCSRFVSLFPCLNWLTCFS